MNTERRREMSFNFLLEVKNGRIIKHLITLPEECFLEESEVFVFRYHMIRAAIMRTAWAWKGFSINSERSMYALMKKIQFTQTVKTEVTRFAEVTSPEMETALRNNDLPLLIFEADEINLPIARFHAEAEVEWEVEAKSFLCSFLQSIVAYSRRFPISFEDPFLGAASKREFQRSWEENLKAARIAALQKE